MQNAPLVTLEHYKPTKRIVIMDFLLIPEYNDIGRERVTGIAR